MIVVRGDAGVPSELRGATFTGEVWANSVLSAAAGVIINDIVFTPGAHTFWHTHERGQILRITAGEGFVCTEGSDPVLVRAGDTVWTPPGERHWHGAAPHSIMSHTAISLGSTNWAEEVSDSDYHSVTKDTP